MIPGHLLKSSSLTYSQNYAFTVLLTYSKLKKKKQTYDGVSQKGHARLRRSSCYTVKYVTALPIPPRPPSRPLLRPQHIKLTVSHVTNED